MSEKEEKETKDSFTLPIMLPNDSFRGWTDRLVSEGYVFITCTEYNAFHDWLLEHFPSLLTYEGQQNELPDGTTLADMDEAIFLISEEYVRRCKAMSSLHVHKTPPLVHNPLCIPDRFTSAIDDVRKIKRALKKGEAGPVRKMLAMEDEEAALRDRKLKATRKDLVEKDKANATLQRKLEEVERPIGYS